MIFKESFGLCPYLAAMQKEQRRNARIRDDEKWRKMETETDIPEAEPLMTKVKAHLSQRVERQTKNRWVTLASEYASEIAFSGPVERDAMREYLKMARENVEKLNKKKQKHSWERTRKRYLEEAF